jgi:hypothetical protein
MQPIPSREALSMADGAKSSYSLTLKGEGISITRDVDQSVARAIVELVLGGSISPPTAAAKLPLDRTPASQPGTTVSRLSLREFLDHAEPKRNPDKIVAIGEYITRHDRQADFTRDDVKARFRTAGEPVPGNFPRDFTWTISNGWIAEDANNAEHYYVTQKGKAAITEKFSGEIKKRSGFKPGNRRRRRGSRAAG